MSLAQPVSLVSLIHAIDSGEVTALAAFERFYQRTLAVEADLKALVVADWDAARATVPTQAAKPLRGLPVGLKDNFDTDFLPTAYGSPIYKGHRPVRNAGLVDELAAVGATLPVKTVTTEFAFRVPGPTGNPYALERSPGGSSSGSAAGVAAGLFPAATGTQTGGSVIRPASYCGIVGFKPGFGVLPIEGVKPFALGLDTSGLFTAGVADMTYLYTALRGQAPATEKRALRIGFLGLPWDDEASAEAHVVLSQARALVVKAGHEVLDVALPPAIAAAHHAHDAIQAFEAVEAFAPELRDHPAGLSAFMRDYLGEAKATDLVAYQDAKAQVAQGRRAFVDLLAGFDAFLTFAAPGIAPPDHSSTGSHVFNRLWTILGVPAITVPGLKADGLPVGVQLVAGLGQEHHLLDVAGMVEPLLRS
jgi:Asp-tRNA(Asn)/Glu-tRNA(Gln) amidotransferase A subunit family amidase